jgi:16S rRNA (cytidine1402-2'-O)-methyltransferase
MSVCPLPLSGSRFEGFLPSRAAARRAVLTALAPERRVFIAREMTKRFETYLVGTPGMLVAEMDVAEQWRGEVVCVLEGAGEAGAGAGEQKRVMRILGGELPPAQAARIGAQILGVRKKDLYRLVSEND